MPLRLWAGVWMPMAHTAALPAEALASVAVVHDAAAHPCHDTHTPESTPAPQATSGAHDPDCHDGACQLCGVCHQSVGLTAWPLALAVFQVHPQPLGLHPLHAAVASPPLTKPPIF
jgi:hypothetical protein